MLFIPHTYMYYLRSISRRSLALLVIFFSILSTMQLEAKEEEEYVVELGNEAILHPTAILPIKNDSSSLSQSYLKTVYDVLSFDINANGMMALINEEQLRKAQAALSEIKSDVLPIKELRSIPISYLITPTISDKHLTLQVAALSDGVVNSLTPIPLTGNIATDRGRIHQLADYLFRLLFDENGIAATRILYSKKTSITSLKNKTETVDSKAEIYVSDYDGANAKQMTSMKSVAVSPVWIPSKRTEAQGTAKAKSFLFVSYLIGQPKIYIMSLKDGHTVRLSKMRGNQLTPAVSSNGSLVAFCSDILGCSDLYMVPFEPAVGEIQKPRQIFKTPSYATGCPTFSPDGTKVAFVSNKSGSPKIYILDIPHNDTKLKELKPRLISKKCRENSAPAWSPDGKKIAFTARTSSERQIWIYDTEHDLEYQLTQGAGHKENPSWAPNSTHLVYQGMKDGRWQLFIIDLNKKSPIQITFGDGDKQFPSWEPQ